MATGVIVWSQTAATNSNADSSINFAEGMAPSAVNDSARALMASVAKWRDDFNGSITTGGTSTAYTVTSNQVESALTANYVIAFVPHATNDATVTLNVDGLGAKPLRSAPATELAAGVLIQGTPYVATYYTSNSGEWILHNFYGSPYGVPIGGMMPYVGSTAPNSAFVLPFGQTLSRTTYASLFSLCGTAFGSGDGSTTFNIIDLRGRIPIGLDSMGGTAAGRITSAGSGLDGTAFGAIGGSETHSLTGAENGPHNHVFTGTAMAPHAHQVVAAIVASTNLQGSGALDSNAQSTTVTTSSVSAGTPTGTISSSGSGTAHNNVQPSVVVPWILRVI